jgi:phosphatidylserine/phosphatidylglycerophosphate/cardiolipin synthase-like enzyme
MSAVKVAIPLLKGKRRFHLAKGRPWSIVEHVLLAAVATRPRTVAELAAEGNVSRRLVLEVLIRLMRAGWVVLSQTSTGIIFRASAAGMSVVGDAELPHVSKPTSRWINFVVDKVTGTLYRSREFPFVEKHVVVQRSQRERLVWIAPRELGPMDEAAAVLATLFDDDELFLGIEPSGDRLVDRYGVATVIGDTVEGLPNRAPPELNRLVLEAAQSAPSVPEGTRSPYYQPGPPVPYAERDTQEAFDAVFRQDDLIIGGGDHEVMFRDVIKRANTRLIIHSTFISENNFATVSPMIHDAARRGVILDILWGEDDEKSLTTNTKAAVNKIRDEFRKSGLESSLRLHPFSTRSHAKLIVANDNRTGRLFAVVGSCNWLSTGFDSFEASLRLEDPRAVGAVLEQVAELTRGTDGHWTELTSDLTRLSAQARSQSAPPGGSRVKMAIILGPQHAQYVRMARDAATSRIFVTSHRLGAANRTAVIVPAIAAAQDRGIDVKVYFGIMAGPISNTDVARLTTASAVEGVEIRPVSEPRLHAKILAWDNDSIVVSSQNWLSADPSEGNLRREVGVFVHGLGLARKVIEAFELARRY